MKMNRTAIAAALLTGLVLSTGCATAPEVQGPVMPFHVAVVTITNPTIRVPEFTDEGFEATDIRWEPDLTELSRSVARALEERCFVRTTLLKPMAIADPDRRRQALVAAAREAGADLVCELDLKYAPEVYRYRLGAPFWTNVFLWGIGGPLSYWVKDHSYYARVDLDAEFFDVEAIDRIAGNSGSEAARVVDASASFQQTPMSFVDRTGSFTPYLLSIVWPAPLISLDNKEVSSVLNDAIQDAILVQLTGEVLSDRVTVLQGGRGLSAIRVDPNEISVSRLPSGTIEVRGTLRLNPETGTAGRITGFELIAGNKTLSFEPGRGIRDSESSSTYWEFAEEIDGAPDADVVQLGVIEGGRYTSKRTYTFPVN